MSVGEPITFEVPGFGGGVNEGLPITGIADNEVTRAENFFTFGTKMRRRKGSAQVTASAYGEDLTALFAYKLSVGTWLLVVGSLTGIAKLDGTGLTKIPIADAVAFPSVSDPWHFRQYKDAVFAARRGSGTMKRVTADFALNAGFPAPAAAPVLADGGAGQLAAGDYEYVVTFANYLTDEEGDPSDAIKITLGASRQVALSSLPVSTNAQVNARRIYRSLLNNRGENFLVAEIQNNFTTTYTDNVLQDDLGRDVSFDNGAPPSNVSLIEIWRERLWASDERDLFFSGIAHPQGFGEFDVIQVYPDDGHKIRALLAFGDRLMVGKTNAMHLVVRAGDSYSLQTLSDKHGVIAADSLKTAEGLLFWYSGENVYRSEGINVNSISTVKIRKSLDLIPDAMKEKVIGFTYPPDSQYWLVCSQGSLTQNEVALIYNYKTDAWSGPFKWPGLAPSYVGDFYDANLAHIIYALFPDRLVWQLGTGKKDGSTLITAKVKTKAFGYDRAGLAKGVQMVSLLCPQLAETATLRVYNDGSAAPAATRAGATLNVPEAWKRIAISTLQALGQATQIEFEYTGESDLDLEQLLIEGMGVTRRGKVI